LEALRSRLVALQARKGNAVLTCSALRKSYRDVLAMSGVRFVYLKVSEPAVRERLAKRRRHFFNPALLESQFATLEEPRDALVVDAERPDLDVTGQVIRDPRVAPPAARARRAAKARGLRVRSRGWLFVILAIVIVGLGLLWKFTPLAQLIQPSRLAAELESFGNSAWGPFAMLLVFVIGGFLMVPLLALLTATALIF